ncbi:MAG: hypothetical protein ACYCQI_00955 [Gammaproteobacteria bacterium]
MFKGRLPTDLDPNDNLQTLNKKITQIEREIDRLSKPLVYLNQQMDSAKAAINQIRKDVGKEDPQYHAAKKQHKDLETRFAEERDKIRAILETSEILDHLQTLKKRKTELEENSELASQVSTKKRKNGVK